MRLRTIRNRRKDASICLLLPLALVYYVLVLLNQESSSSIQERRTARIHQHKSAIKSNKKIAQTPQPETETRVRSTDNTSPDSDEIETPPKSPIEKKEGKQNGNIDEKETIQTPKSSSLEIDKRMEIERPFMETVSESFFSSIKDIEQHFQPDERCSNWGGVKFIERFKNSSVSLLKPLSKSQLEYYKLQGSNKELFYAENVSILVRGKDVAPRLYLNGEYTNDDAKYTFAEVDQNNVLGEMTMSIQTSEFTCSDEEYIQDPILLVDSPIDTNNWWFLLKTILHNFIAVTILQSKLYGEYKNSIRVLHTMHDGSYVKSFTDAFDFFFSNQRARDSRQIWDVHDIGTLLSQKDKEGNMQQRKMCFRKVAWTLGADTLASDILVNQQHAYDDCFSSIIYAYAAHLRATLSIPILPRPKKPRVVWVARDTSDEANPTDWQRQRIIHNQEQVIEYLKSKCKEMEIEFMVADFYANKVWTTYQEQATFVSKANVMIGMHGAGLNMFHFMPFGSNIVEIHSGTNANMNSRNFVKQTGVGTYYTIDANIDSDRNLDPEPVWNALKEAILNWQEGTNAMKR
ncbi:hypothetical protein CTEN210_02720 [Chaetoceros tenuissimus]|uniref:Glycosyltransferase 61 catalytic domain-containing protein n=1 Tax=Chaetoceros tenuissimus TaxID=426638 RepID=A0AAD3H0Y2_9STRA|nr:hypothetical protein CTEN210_02720 [Chaetoceros tenuissimus]